MEDLTRFMHQGGQVWSLTQFYSVDFSQSRIGVKKCVFNKRTIKVCVSCSWRCPGTSAPSAAHLRVALYLCSSGSNARGESRALEGRRVSLKSPSRVREGDEGVAGRNIYVIKKQTEKIELVTRLGLGRLSSTETQQEAEKTSQEPTVFDKRKADHKKKFTQVRFMKSLKFTTTDK